MLAKLLKQELKDHSGVMGLLCAASMGTGLAGGLTMRYLFSAEGTAQRGALYTLATVFLIFSFLALAVFSVGGGFYLLYQFYKRKFTDEGYLTFTLPVSGWQIFLSSLINIVLWSIVIGIVTILAFLAIFFVGLVNSEFLMDMKYALSQFRQIFDSEFYFSIPRANLLLMIAAGAVQYVGQFVVTLTCITLGSVLAKRRKILGAIGAYWGYSMIFGAVSSRAFSPILLEGQFSLNGYYAFMLVYMLIVSVSGFLLSCWLMKKKLNLP